MNPVKTILKAMAIAVVSAAMAFFVGNFLGIAVIGIYGAVKHITPDYTIAYRIVGLSVAGVVFVTMFIGAIVYDFKQVK